MSVVHVTKALVARIVGDRAVRRKTSTSPPHPTSTCPIRNMGAPPAAIGDLSLPGGTLANPVPDLDSLFGSSVTNTLINFFQP